jgi:hypothetical protein
MPEVRPFQIRAIFTDNLASVWDIWLHGDDYTAPELRRPVRIRVCALIWEFTGEQNGFPSGCWRVSETADEMDEEKINNAPNCFKEILRGLIDDSLQS